MIVSLRLLLLAGFVAGLVTSPAAAQDEGAGTLDAPPASTAGAPPAARTPFDGDVRADDAFDQDEDSLEAPPPAAPPATRSEPIPPPPAPSAGYGTPIYPGPTGEPSAFAPADGVRLPSNLATRIRVLDSSLQVLSARGSNRILDGVLSLVSGGVSIGLGIWARRSGFVELGRYAFVLGSVSVIRGVLDLTLTPNPRTPAIRYAHMPTRSLEEAEARLRYGESALEDLARRSRMVRVIDASLSIASGIAIVPIFLHPKDYEFTEPLDYFILVAAGISVITGIINLATRTEAERRWDAYEELRERLDAEEDSGGVVALEPPSGPRLLGAGVAPVQGGATAGVLVGF